MKDELRPEYNHPIQPDKGTASSPDGMKCNQGKASQYRHLIIFRSHSK
mgnify:CR=1 FL=1